MEKNGNMQNTWIEEFYNETNADNRLRILNDNKDNSELDSFREKLWIARYGKRKPKKDKFVGYLMEMKYLSEGNSVDISGSKRKQLYEIINGLCLLNSDEIQDEKREILFLELKNVFFKFIEVSKNGSTSVPKASCRGLRMWFLHWSTSRSTPLSSALSGISMYS